MDAYLRETLTAARPDYGWLSEETVDSPERLTAARTFVVDPIDGTRAFVGGLDTWCVSIAVVEKGRSLAGVLECPSLRETFSALPGQGATLNGQPIRVRPLGRQINIAAPKVLVDGLPPALRARAFRVAHVPSLAYRVAMIAKGALDATFVKPNAHDWDLAAADLILHEAGGSIISEGGERPLYAWSDNPRHGVLAAGSGALLEAAGDALAALARLT